MVQECLNTLIVCHDTYLNPVKKLVVNIGLIQFSFVHFAFLIKYHHVADLYVSQGQTLMCSFVLYVYIAIMAIPKYSEFCTCWY